MAFSRTNVVSLGTVIVALACGALTFFAPHWRSELQAQVYDTDGDGVSDRDDECPNSDLRETVIIGDCDSGVANELSEIGCTVADLIAECNEDGGERDEFIHCVAEVTNDLKKAKIITGKEKAAIQRCAAKHHEEPEPDENDHRCTERTAELSVEADSCPPFGVCSVDVACEPGEFVTGGGCSTKLATGPAPAEIRETAPLGQGWRCTFTDWSAGDTLKVSAICCAE